MGLNLSGAVLLEIQESASREEKGREEGLGI
jgi:hypothetical protein